MRFARRAGLAVALALAGTPALAQLPAGDPVAHAIRSGVDGKLKPFYRTRGYWPLWVKDGALAPEADRLLALLEDAELDGLDPDDYLTDRLRRAVDGARAGDPAALGAAELRLTQALVAYVRDARRPPRVTMTYLDAELQPKRPGEADVLRGIARAASLGAYLDAGGWMNPAYMKLRTALGRHREAWADLPAIAIPAGPTLKAGSKGERVRLLRARLGLAEGAAFDKVVATRLRAFQAAHGLKADGVGGAGTIAALNRAAGDYERLIRINLERARLLPDPYTRHILVDAASARLWLYRDGAEQGAMKVVVGKESEQTPMLAGMMRYVTLNPYWNVPQDLVQRRIAPRVLAGGPRTAAGFEVLPDYSAAAQPIDPKQVDWAAIADGRLDPRVRQLPGPGNAMGRIKFMFPNDLGIYLHDTPERALFAKAERRFSSGCVRLEDAPALARWLFGAMPKAAGTPEQNVSLPEPVPVFITYLTASPTGDGIAFLDDAYGRDRGTQLAAR